MLRMPQWTQGTYTKCIIDEAGDGQTTKEDFHSTTAGQSVSWRNPPRYKTKGEKAIHQRLKKKLEEKKNQKK
jgi:hypothetical protein